MSTPGDKASRERVRSWGMVQTSDSWVRRVHDRAGVLAAFEEARRCGVPIGLRGGGNSYGDAALAQDAILLDFSPMNAIRSWDAASGILVAEPGVTIEDCWRTVIPDGYWPPVVPGTMRVTLGGAAAMNIHGKNNFKVGTIGEHILSFDLLVADGRVVTCSPEENEELYFAVIGGFGCLGVIVELTLVMKRVHSGLLEVEPHSVRNFEESIDLFYELEDGADYLVGWHDGFARGDGCGRGLLHRARHLVEGEDERSSETLRLEQQHLPPRFFGVVPKGWLWAGLWFALNDPGMRLVNAMKYLSGTAHARRGPYRQVHAAYHFLLDYVPNWKYAYRPGGLIQFQPFVPRNAAARVFRQLMALARGHGYPPYLCVTKRHRPDPFLMTHAVDGFSLAMDIKVTRRNRERVWTMARGMEEVVLDAGGRFYFAKDSLMSSESFRRAYPEESVARFLDLKRQHDPDSLFQTDLFRRILGEGVAAPGAERTLAGASRV